jgi:hypothetical protein
VRLLARFTLHNINFNIRKMEKTKSVICLLFIVSLSLCAFSQTAEIHFTNGQMMHQNNNFEGALVS